MRPQPELLALGLLGPDARVMTPEVRLREGPHRLWLLLAEGQREQARDARLFVTPVGEVLRAHVLEEIAVRELVKRGVGPAREREQPREAQVARLDQLALAEHLERHGPERRVEHQAL